MVSHLKGHLGRRLSIDPPLFRALRTLCSVCVGTIFIKGWQELAPYPEEDPVSLRLFLAAARSSMEGHLVEFFK